MTWNDDVVASWRIVGYENRVTPDESFTQARKEFAEIPSGAATTVFYELELREGPGSDAGPLGDVELRWVTPSTGESNRQHATILSQRDAGFPALDDPLLKMGAIVALASDLYSSLPRAEVHRRLTPLRTELWLLEERLGGLEAYRDFEFLLEHITRDAGDSPRPPRAPRSITDITPGFNAPTGFAAHELPSGGAELVIIGVGFDAGDTVAISLYGSQSLSAYDDGGSIVVPIEQQLGELTSDGNGVIVGEFEVELSPGLYVVQAAATRGQIVDAALMVK